MMSDQILINEDDRKVITITFNRPEKGNAFTAEMIDDLTDYLQDITTSRHGKLLLIMSNGNHFCTGADLDWMKSSLSLSEEENRYDAKRLADLYFTIYNCDIPTVCMVHGSVYGGGLGIAACSDIVIAAENAKFCFSEVKLGLAPATISPYVVNAIGSRLALYHFLLADVFNTQTALEMDLVHEVVDIKELEIRTQEIVDALLFNDSEAMLRIKRLVRSIAPIDEGICEDTVDTIARLRQSKSAQDRLGRFLKSK